jgi:hypothetical protein
VNPLTLSIALRRRTPLETCDLAVAFVRRAFRPYLYLWLGALGLPGIALYALHRYAELDWFSTWALLAAWIVLVQGFFTLLGGELLFANQASPRRVARRFFANFGSYLFVLVVSRVIFVAFAFTVVLLPRGFAGSTLISEVVLLEGLRGDAALRRARRLGATLGRPMLDFGVALLFAFAAAAVLGDKLGKATLEFLLSVGSPFESLLDDGGSLYAMLGVLAAVPFVTTARLLAYVDGRAEQDGWDIQLRFQALRAREEQTT